MRHHIISRIFSCRTKRQPEKAGRRPGKSGRKAAAAAGLLLIVQLLSGCSKIAQTSIQFTAGLSDHELFRIGQEVCETQEAMVLIASERNSYEQVYGDALWQIPVGEGQFQDVVLDSVRDLLAQMKCMVLMAEEYNITLSESEKRLVREAADAFCQAADAAEMTQAGITEDDVYQMMYEYRLSHYLISELTRDVDVEVSDNDARVVQVQQIFLSIYENTGSGRVLMSEEDRRSQRELLETARRRVEDGEDFAEVAEAYGAGQQSQLAVGRGEMEAAYEEAVFALADGEISDVIETEDGFYLVKCLEDYDMEATQARKEEMGAYKKEEAFTQLYDTFCAGLTAEFNQDAWGEISMAEGTAVQGADFFGIYDSYFGDQE